MIVRLSIVIPVYRSSATIPELYRRIVSALERVEPSFEIILVEDCGGDDSWRVINEIAARDKRVRGIQLSRNFGQHAATICGFSQAKGEWIATLDDDLEQAPESLPDLYRTALEGHDLVYGVYPQRSHKAWRNITSATARWLFNKAIPSLNYTYTSFRVIRGDLARELQRFDSPFPFVDGYLSWLTNRYASVEVPHGVRANGSSNYTLKKLITHTVNIFVTFSDLPLRMAEFGSCHRNEPSGSLHGIMRVRNFVQDDAHIFCAESQVQAESAAFIELLQKVYADFGFTDILVKLSTRPERRVGSDEQWDAAEAALAAALDAQGLAYELQPGEGAFYGPKIEFSLKDCLQRVWQCGTLQLDFVLPERLDATYIAEDGQKLAFRVLSNSAPKA